MCVEVQKGAGEFELYPLNAVNGRSYMILRGFEIKFERRAAFSELEQLLEKQARVGDGTS